MASSRDELRQRHGYTFDACAAVLQRPCHALNRPIRCVASSAGDAFRMIGRERLAPGAGPARKLSMVHVVTAVHVARGRA